MDEMKLLIVEDNFQMRRMICRFVSNICDEIREEADGALALDAYEKFQPDWVLMDFQLKQTNGIEASKQIINKFPNAKIIMVTNYDLDSLRKRAEKTGICNFVLKENLLDLQEILV